MEFFKYINIIPAKPAEKEAFEQGDEIKVRKGLGTTESPYYWNIYKVASDGSIGFVRGITDDQNTRLERLSSEQISKVESITTGDITKLKEDYTKAEIDQQFNDVRNFANSSRINLNGSTVLPVPPRRPDNTIIEDAWVRLSQNVTYTQLGGSPLTGIDGHETIAEWNNEDGEWVLVDMGELPDNSSKLREWDSGKSYGIDEQVRVGDNVYTSLVANNSTEPQEESTTWKLLIDVETLNKFKYNSETGNDIGVPNKDFNIKLGYINQNGNIVNPSTDSGWARHAPKLGKKGDTIRVVSRVDAVDSQPALIIYSSPNVDNSSYLYRVQLPLANTNLETYYTFTEDAYYVAQFKRLGNESLGKVEVINSLDKVYVSADSVDKEGGVASYELNNKILNNSKYGKFYDDTYYTYRRRMYFSGENFINGYHQDWKGTDLIKVEQGDLVEITGHPGANTTTPVGIFFDVNGENPQAIYADVAGQVSVKQYYPTEEGYVVGQYRRATIDGIGKIAIYKNGNKEPIFGGSTGGATNGFISSNKNEFEWQSKGQLFSASEVGMNTVYWPYVIETSKIEGAVGKYYMYFSTDHEPEVSGIFMAYSDRLDGGWELYGKLIGINQEGVTTEVETPTVIWDEIANEFRMYVQTHGGSEDPLGYSQYTTIFSSVDGVNWTWVKRALSINNNDFLMGDGHNGYFHIVKAGGMYVANHLTGGTSISHSSISYSYDGLNWLTDRNQYNVQMHASFNNNVWGSSMQGAFFEIKGKIYSLAGTGQSASGNIPKNHFLGLTELGCDFRTQIGYTRKVADLENPDIRSVSAFYNPEDGLVYVYYVVNDGIYLGTFKITE